MPPSRKSTSTHYDSSSSSNYSSSYRDRTNRKMTWFDWLVRVPVAIAVLGFMFFFLISKGTLDVSEAKKVLAKIPEIPSMLAQEKEKRESKAAAYEETAKQDSYYVAALGRSCDWDAKHECYYDVKTDCYFWYNNTTKTHTWQYWYEGISSDYGDFGWMEYDTKEKTWYIEVSDGYWTELPERYDRSRLWHIE